MGSSARQHRQHLGLAIAVAVCALVSAAVSGSTSTAIHIGPPKPEFRLARMAYSDGYLGNRGGAWRTDAPEAEFHLSGGIRRLTRIDTIDPGPRVSWDNVLPVRPGGPLAPDEEDLFNYPFYYGVEVGRWHLSDEEAAHLREYLLRGGFLMVDDFHGDEQWEEFWESMQRVFPDREWKPIPENHEILHVLYDLDMKTQIPGSAALMRGRTCEWCEEGGAEPHWRGIFDDKGRVMVVMNFNMDMGDAWELADEPDYPQPYTALAYRFAVSYALYAMTH